MEVLSSNQQIVLIGSLMALYTPAQLLKGIFATLEFADGSIWLQSQVCAYNDIEFVCIF